jgi:hypothetical protein
MDDVVNVFGDILPPDDVPVLLEGRLLNLPANAVQNADRSVVLTLIAPKLFRYSERGQIQESTIETLLLHRLNGVDVAKMRAARDPTNTALALSLGWSAAKLDLLMKVLDARDLGAAEDVLGAFLDMSDVGGLPEHAEETAEGVVLPMAEHPAEDAAGTSYNSFTFKFLTAAQMRQAKDAPDRLVWAVSFATGLTPKDAKDVLSSMDGADAMAMSRVARFLSSAGRQTGR